MSFPHDPYILNITPMKATAVLLPPHSIVLHASGNEYNLADAALIAEL